MRKRMAARLAVLVAGCFLIANTGWAYYYYTYFNSAFPPYVPIYARYDVDSLPNNTVPFFVSNQGPFAMYPGDSFPAIISQIRAAANIWSSVSTSRLRMAYGGLYTPGTVESAAGIQVQFSDDIPPGLLAFTSLQSFGNLTPGPTGTFVPVFLSVTHLPMDMSQMPSYGEQFFVTMVHEFGHTLGLQHTLASSVMSTYNTTASTKANPLGVDDIAAISQLYPTPSYLPTVGSISGTVTLNGNGVNLASVVAISPSNPAICTLTNPDGTYQINGIPPGLYYVYVHPLPPPVEGESTPDNIFFPHNSNNVWLAPNTGFATQFYPNTVQPNQAQVIPVTAANVTQGINFQVAASNTPGIASVRTYGYIQNTYVIGAPLIVSEKTTVAATGVGLLQTGNLLTPGLNVGMLGSAAQINNLRPYPPPNPYIAVDVSVGFTSGPGPKHLLFSTPENLYVLPAGFTVVDAPPPLISAIAPAGNGNSEVAIAGQQFTSSTQVMFDGLPAVIQSQSSNLMIVTPPPAPAGYTASVAAFNADGQSSLFLKPVAPPYTYPSGAAFALTANPSLVVSPSVIPAGGNVTVDVQGGNTNFMEGVTTVGFGTSDVQVTQITVLSPTHLEAVVSPGVSVGTAGITVTTGLEVVSQALGSQVTVTNTKQ
jgi:hypothetical protein